MREGPIDELERSGGGEVIVTTPSPERLMAAVRDAGGRAEHDHCSGRLLIAGMDAARVGDLAHDARVPVHELSSTGASLEDVFFGLTGEEPA